MDGKQAMGIAARETLGLDKKAFIHWYYNMVIGSATILSFTPECKLRFGEDPLAESVIENHADMMCFDVAWQSLKNSALSPSAATAP